MTARPNPRDADPLTLDAAGGDAPSRSDEAVFGVMVFFATLGVGLIIGIDKGWAFGMGIGWWAVLGRVDRWWARERLRR